MKVVHTIADLRSELAERERIGFVPTMGFLHEGHLSLIRRAREECATVVVSIFVNPTQFGDGEDLQAYPRDLDRDLQLAAAADFVFVPSVAEIYPDGFATTVEVQGLTDVLCGAARPGHFAGVTTVVTKLFNIVGPEVAYFGQKDAQQAIVIRKLVTDLNLAVRIEVCPTVREPDGLAMSSRNAYLSAAERERARGLNLALRAAEDAARRGGDVLAAAREQLQQAGIEPEYIELRSAQDLTPVERVNGSTLLAVAAQVGRARLIDNTILTGDK
jgi:pantoate--beta-alanine ligase